MSNTARRLRRYTAGAALVLFPALLVVQAPIDPATGGTGEVMYTAATEHRAALIASMALLIVCGILMIPAVMGIVHQARDRGAGLANVGAVLGVLGGFGHFGIAMFYLTAMALPGAIAFPLITCFGLGVVTLAWAAWRAGLVGWWGPPLVTAAVLVHFGLPFQPPTAIELTLLVALTVVFGHLGLRVLRMTDTEWEGVPEVAEGRVAARA